MAPGPWFIPPGAKAPPGMEPPQMRHLDDPFARAVFSPPPADDRGPIMEMSPGDAAEAVPYEPELDPIDRQAWLAMMEEYGGSDPAPPPGGPRLTGDVRRQAYEALGRRAERTLGRDLDDLAGFHASSPSEEVAQGRVISDEVRQAQDRQGLSPLARQAKIDAAMAASPVRTMKSDPALGEYLERETDFGRMWKQAGAELARARRDQTAAAALQGVMDYRDPMEAVGRIYTSRPVHGFEAFSRRK